MTTFGDNFNVIQDYLGDQGPPKISQKGHLRYAALVRKHLKMYNLTITNATLINRTSIMYLDKFFLLPRSCGITHRAQEGVNKKPAKMSQKVSVLAQF